MDELAEEFKTLQLYAKRRYERLIKLSRELSLASLSHLEVSPLLHVVRLYGDLLAQAMIDNVYNPNAEMRVLKHLVVHSHCAGDLVQRRVSRLEEMFEHDWNLSQSSGKEHFLHKEGAIAFSFSAISRWMHWLQINCPFHEGYIVAIMSRALTEASLIGRTFNLPVRCIAFSRMRLRHEAIIPLETKRLLKFKYAPIMLVDAHAGTGETLKNCWKFLQDNQLRRLAASITCDETNSLWSVPDAVHIKAEKEPWAFFGSMQCNSGESEWSFPPLIVLCGLPGSGKTLVRKELSVLTGWSAFSWSRTIRRIILEEFKDLSMESVRLLTKEESRDPEFTVREFILDLGTENLDSPEPIIVDGVKTPRALAFLARTLGRTPIIVEVYRNCEERSKAIAERGDFDDSMDDERVQLLEQIGLRDLLSRAVIKVDASDSNVDRFSRKTIIGVKTATSLVTIVDYVRRKSTFWD